MSFKVVKYTEDLDQYMELTDVIKDLEGKMSGEEVAEGLTKVLDGKRLLVYRKVVDGSVEWADEMNGSIGNYYEVKYVEFDDPGYSVKFINNNWWHPVESLLVEKPFVHDGFVQEVSKKESNIDLSGYIRLTEVIEKLESSGNGILAIVSFLNKALYKKEVYIDSKCVSYRGATINWYADMDKFIGTTCSVLSICAYEILGNGFHVKVRQKTTHVFDGIVAHVLPLSILVEKYDVAHLWALKTTKSNVPKTLSDLVALQDLVGNNGDKLCDAFGNKVKHIWEPLIGAHVKITRGSNNAGWVKQMDDTVGEFAKVTEITYPGSGGLRLKVGKWYYHPDSICLSLGIIKRLDIKLTRQVIGMLGLSSDHADELHKAISRVEIAMYNLSNSIDRIIEAEELERRSDENQRVYATPSDIKDYLGKGRVFHPVYNKDILMGVIVEPVAVSFDGKRIIGKDGKRYTKLLVV